MESKTICFILLLTGCTNIFSFSNDSIFYKNLLDKLSIYNEKFPEEKIYVNLDKSVYKSGEELWFKAFVFEAQKNDSTFSSKKLTVMIFNILGKAIFEGRYRIENSVVNGDLILPPNLEDGMYTFMAYSSWMENGNLDMVFRKFLEINNSKVEQFSISVSRAANYYLPGLPYKITAHLESPDGRSIENQKIWLTASDGNKNILGTDAYTNKEGKADMEIVIPSGQKKVPLTITCEARIKKNTNHTTMVIYPQPEEINLGFFAEGGSIISNTRQAIVVTAKDINGKPVAVEGKIIDNNGTVVSLFSTTEFGYGRFHLTSQTGNMLHAQITKPIEISKDYILPEVKSTGVSLSLIKNTNDTAIFKMESNSKDELTELKCIMYSHNNVFGAGNTAIKHAGILKVFLGDQPSGLAQFVVFNKNNEIVAQRLIFIDHSNHSIIEAKTEKSSYVPRSRVNLEVKVKWYNSDTLNANLTLSVCKSDLVDTFKNMDIKTAYYLNPELVNRLYFSPIDKAVDARISIDDLLIANNFGQCNLNNILQTKPETEEYFSRDGLTGLVLNKNGQPIPGTNVSVMDPSVLKQFQSTADNQGWFNFPSVNADFDEKVYSPTLVSADTNNVAKIYLLNKFDESLKIFSRINPIFINPVYNYYNDTNNLKIINDLLVNQLYQEQLSNEISRIDSLRKDANKRQLYDHSKNLLEIIREIKPYTLTNGKIVFSSIPNSLHAQGGAKFVVDGFLFSSEDVTDGSPGAHRETGTDLGAGFDAEHFDVSSIENVKVLTDPNDILKYTAYANSIIEITTKRGKAKSKSTFSKNSEIAPHGIHLTKKFNSPVYSHLSILGSDNRTTLIWEPSVTLNDKGEATIVFYTSDVIGTFIGKVEGFVNGESVLASFRFNVK